MTVEVVPTNEFQVVFEEDKSLVTINFQGLQASLLEALTIRVDDIEDQIPGIITDAAGDTAQVAADLNALEAVVTAQGLDITAEEAARIAADQVLNDFILAVNGGQSADVAAEEAARIAADAAEVTARNAAIAAAIAPVQADLDIAEGLITGLGTDVSIVEAAQVTLEASMVTLTGVVDDLSDQFDVLEASFDTTNDAVLAEMSARAAADVAMQAEIDAAEAATAAHLSDAADAHDASAISYINTASGLAAAEVQAAIDEIMSSVGPSASGFFRFDDVTAAADPGAGQIRFNHATPASVTALYVDQLSQPGTDINRLFAMLTVGMALLVQQKNDSARFLQCTISGALTNNTGWWTIPVTIVASGTLPGTGASCNFVLLGGGAIPDHGTLSGLSDDDHTQYHNDSRGDARYSLLAHNHDADYADIAHNHDADYADIAHNHDADYADIAHNHDADYSDIAHDHDADYAPLVHNHWSAVPASAGATGTAGEMAYESGWLYVCVATDTWERAVLATW